MEIEKINQSILFLVVTSFSFLILMFFVSALPQGPVIVYNNTEISSSAASGGTERADARSTVTTMVFNLTAQSYKWKAYIGNVTGKLTLDDADNYTIYDWTLISFQGEVYATRKSTTVNWSAVDCANTSELQLDETALNHISSESDSVTNTMSRLNHTGFYAANEYVVNGTCFALYTYNGTIQQNRIDAVFQEVVLFDNDNTVYTTLLESDQSGFDNINSTSSTPNTYDFQILLPEDPSFASSPTTYYFYMELS